MKKQIIKKAGMVMLLFFAFVYAQAGFVPVISTTPACHNNDGSVTITGTGDPGPYSFYIYGNGIYQGDSNAISSYTFTGLAPGIYQFLAYSSVGDQQPGTFEIVATDNVTIATTQPVCPVSSTGSAVATVNGGTPPYTYLWSNGATTQSVNNLPVNQNTLTVTDAAGCQAIATDTVQIISNVHATIAHSGPACSGVLTVTGSGGTTPYSYVWSTGATTASISGLTNSTTYIVSVSDANGCGTIAASGTTNTGLAFDSLHTQVAQASCGNNGSISVVMASGTAPYTFVWSNGATTSTITGLSQNTYTVTATDANGCTGYYNYYLYSNSLVEYNYFGNPSCGTSTGDIQVYAYGGTSPYSFTWSNDANNHTSFDTILAAGTYYYTVSDNSGCSITDSVHLIPQGNFTAQVSVSPIICPATTGGSMTVNVTGAGPYTYLWSNGSTTQTLNNLTHGSYFTVTVFDGNGCQTLAYSSDSISIIPPFTDTLLVPACGNSATISATGNTGPFTYLWSNGATTATIGYTLYTTYTITITDAHGCSDYKYFYPYTTGLQLDSMNNMVNPTCTTGGGIKAVPLNGVAPFHYVWSNGATTDSIGGLSSGYYQVTATDANGCSGIAYYYLQQNSISVSPGNTYPSCGGTNGSITLYPYGGTLPYNYAWSNNTNNHSATASGLSTGTYTYTVTDAGGCSSTGSETLTAQGNFIVNVTTTPTGCNPNVPTGAINVTVANGGTPPFTFSWQVWYPNGLGYFDTTTSAGFGGLAYSTSAWLISATDANGCTDSSAIYTSMDTGGAYINYAAACYDDITGYVYTDLNGNCSKDAGEPGNAGTIVIASGNGATYYANTDSNGFYDIQVLPGSYNVTTYSNGGACIESSCIASYSPALSGTGAVSANNNFGFTSGPTYDLVVHTGYYPSSPGSVKEYWVYYYNQGNTTANNAVLTFVHDPNLTLASTTPSYSSYDAATRTITWNLGTVPPSQWIIWTQKVTMDFNVPSNLPLGTMLTAYDSITPIAGDCDPSNNVQLLSDDVSGSHDPNEKSVSPSGNIPAGQEVLNYTIRFQNTGNAPAIKVVITDTLSPLVDPATLVVGASNFPYKYTLSGTGVLTFTFDPIYLTDTAQSVDSSIGFVNYSIHINGGIPAGAQIKNTANIFFDLNPAIVTNTTVSTLIASTVGLKNISSANMSVSVSPNPVHDKSLFSINGATGEVLFQVHDIAGQKIFEETTSNPEILFEGGAFAPGMYVYTARDTKGNICTGKIVIAH
jgi:SprB repeat/Domain of unknown function DUF11